MNRSCWMHSLLGCTLLAAGNLLAASVPATEAEVRGELASLQPEGVRIESVQINGKRGTVVGISPSNAVLSGFMRSIDNSVPFAAVELIQIARAEGGIRFDLSMDIRCSDTAVGTCLEPKKGVPAMKNGNSVHKCRINGVLHFQDRPCAEGTEAQ